MQVYVSFDINEPQNALENVNAYLYDIRSLMIANKLKINSNTTEMFIIGSPQTHSNHDVTHDLLVGKSTIAPSESPRNLGVVFDKQISMQVR